MLVGVVVVIFSFGNIVFQFAWTEPFFAAVLIGAAYYAIKALGAKEISIAFLIFCSVLPVIRYFGIYYLVWINLFVIVALRKSISWAGVLKLLSCWVPFAILVTKNKIYSGSFFGVRVASPYGVWENINITFDVVFNDLGFVLPVGVLVLVLSLAFGVYCHRVETLNVRKANQVAFLVGLVFTSLVGQVYSSSTVHIDPISTRFYFPIYPIFFVAISIVLAKEHMFGGLEKPRPARCLVKSYRPEPHCCPPR